jgi:hypothetical protein
LESNFSGARVLRREPSLHWQIRQVQRTRSRLQLKRGVSGVSTSSEQHCIAFHWVQSQSRGGRGGHIVMQYWCGTEKSFIFHHASSRSGVYRRSKVPMQFHVHFHAIAAWLQLSHPSIYFKR